MGDYSVSRTPKCPYCEREITDPWEVFSQIEETIEHQCGYCDELFTISRSVVFYYRAEQEVGHG